MLRRKNSLTATVDDSYFSGTQNIGAIVGSLGDNAVVDNCVSYAVVEGIGIDTGSHTRVSYGVIVNSWFRDFLK